jgi:SH3-like domain-containing protein
VSIFAKFMLAILVFFAAASAWALEYQSVLKDSILYDTPSNKAKRLFIIRSGTPVEVVINVEHWAKVRDATGGIAWIEKQVLGQKRTIIVTAQKAEVRKAPDNVAPVIFEAEQEVVLDFIEAGPPGWVQVRHRGGLSGFARLNQVWGF